MALNQAPNGLSARVFTVVGDPKLVLSLDSKMQTSGSSEQTWRLLEFAETLLNSSLLGVRFLFLRE